MGILETIGIEIEGANVPRDNKAMSLGRRYGWQVVTDGSLRNHQYYLANMKINSDGRRLVPAANTEMGVEFVSPILAVSQDTWRNQVSNILEFLYSGGEGIDLRSSVHIHVCLSGAPLELLKSLTKLLLFSEDGFYRLGCGEGKVHRGSLHKDYKYCRPLTEGGPQITYLYNGGRAPCFAVDKLQNVRSWEEYSQWLCRYDTWHGNKWFTPRYTWFNYLSMLVHGTAEFRLFNFTKSESFIYAWTQLCLGIVKQAFKMTYNEVELPQHPLGEGAITLNEMLATIAPELNDSVIYTLEQIWDMAAYQPAIHGRQYSHIGFSPNWDTVRSDIRPDYLDSEDYVYDSEYFSSPEHSLVAGDWIIASKPTTNVVAVEGVGEDLHMVDVPTDLHEPVVRDMFNDELGQVGINNVGFRTGTTFGGIATPIPTVEELDNRFREAMNEFTTNANARFPQPTIQVEPEENN